MVFGAFGHRGVVVPLRRRSTDWGMYLFSVVVGVAGGIYIFLEPLRELRDERSGGGGDMPAPQKAPIPEHLQQQKPAASK
mmetsp:Transcript_8471/g.34885  ORF Transcript_8471/g.34885 Transcript_8471/m.34885 type:complete len:80 (+) Transcript_8471:56-295(+)